MALPRPLEAERIVIHDAPLLAVQSQVLPVVMLTVPVETPAPTEALVGVIAYVHALPAWVTVKALPAMVRMPERLAVVGLAATVYVTVPGPIPLEPLVIVNHATPLLAVHAQLAPVSTATLPLPVPEPTEALVGVMA